MLEIREVKTNKEIKDFILFPHLLYRGNPHWIPELISDEIANLRKDKNPAFEFCDAKYFMAFRDGEPVGRIGAILSRRANEKWNTKILRFSRVDFIDDLEVSRALFGAVEAWAKELGMECVQGPMGFTDMDKEGMLIEGFDEDPMFITIFNYPYYVDHLKALGYEKAVDWLEYKITVPKEPMTKMDQLMDKVMQRYQLSVVSPKKKRDLKPLIDPAFDLLNTAYSGLYGMVELTPALIKKYTAQFITMINPRYILGVKDSAGKLIAVGVMMPSMTKAVQKSNGRLFPLGWWRILRTTHEKNTVMDLALVAVDPEWQGRGINAVLLSLMTRRAIEDGMTYAETGPELETNEKVQSMWKHFEVRQHRRRRCWTKTL